METTAHVLLKRVIDFIRKTKRAERKNPSQLTRATRSTPPSSSSAKPNEQKKKSITIEEGYSFDPSLKLEDSITEILAATEKISADMVLGEGTLGLVYKAELSNGLKFAVKRFFTDGLQGFMEFRSELEILGKIRHRNIVRILGYYVSGREKILVYEFFKEGSLDRRIHHNSRSRSRSRSLQLSSSPLSWKTRHKIIKDVANGLAYMHDLEKPIIHRDVKASNILLDSGFEAHIADFGLARMIEPHHTHVTTQAAGTPGYMPPEYEDGSVLATASGDVYSFGVLMLEVATGKRPSLPVYLNSKAMSFMQGIRTMVAKNLEIEMLDPNIRPSDSDMGLVKANVNEYFRIAMMCTNVNPLERPTMRDVAELLTRNLT